MLCAVLDLLVPLHAYDSYVLSSMLILGLLIVLLVGIEISFIAGLSLLTIVMIAWELFCCARNDFNRLLRSAYADLITLRSFLHLVEDV